MNSSPTSSAALKVEYNKKTPNLTNTTDNNNSTNNSNNSNINNNSNSPSSLVELLLRRVRIEIELHLQPQYEEHGRKGKLIIIL